MSAAQGLGNNYGLCVRDDTTETASPSKWELQETARRLLPGCRLDGCHRIISNQVVKVRRDSGKAWFSGLAVCGQVWTCPVCARKIAESRRDELQGAIDKAIGQGMDVALITLTFSHSIYHRIDDLLPRLTEGLRKLKSGRAWQDLKKRYDIVGSVRALEVTHGNNGWHPHTHEIEFFNTPLSAEQRDALRQELFVLWEAACIKVGLPLPNEEHGVDVRGATRAAQYVGKWGFASEVSRPVAKKGWSGRTPWQLLEDAHHGDVQAGQLWIEFAEAFHGRRQLIWSRGLRDLLQLGELFSDDELADLESVDLEDVPVDVVELDRETWTKICRAGARGMVLHLAMLCKHELEGWLDSVREKVPVTWHTPMAYLKQE